MKRKGELILREIAGEHILVPVGATALRIQGMINLSESGVLIWERMASECTERELVDLLLEQYDIDEATAQADVAGFLEQLRSLELL
ncbi:MAG: PqqD family protein [Candidatus Onthomonas sp.]